MRELQIAVGRLEIMDLDAACEMLECLADDLSPPANDVEHVVLRGLLLEVACRSGDLIHARAHHTSTTCDFVPCPLLTKFWRAPGISPEKTFRRWLDSFCTAFRAAHPPSAACRSARLIRQDFHRTWSLAMLARQFHVTPSHLRRTFQQEFGTTARDYQQVVRMRESLEQLPKGNVDAIALGVGYKSKKNFYRAFHKLTGLTPTGFRELSTERASHITASVRTRLHPPATAADLSK